MFQTCAYKDYGEKLLFTCRIVIVFIIINCVFFQGDNVFWKDEDDMLTTNMRLNLRNNSHVWRPKKCSMHNYDSREFKKCWRSPKKNVEFTSIFFIGDSHENRLFSVFATQFCNSTKSNVFSSKYCQSGVNRLSIAYQYLPTIDNRIKEMFLSWEKQSYVPDFLLMGCNLHPILDSNASNSYRHEFRRNLTNFLPFIDRLARKTSVLWYVQPPVIDEKIREWRKVIDNKNVNFYNGIVTKQGRLINKGDKEEEEEWDPETCRPKVYKEDEGFQYEGKFCSFNEYPPEIWSQYLLDGRVVYPYELSRTNVILWTSAREIAIDTMSSYVDDVHVGVNSTNYYIQILSNFWCNHRFSYQNGTCSKRRDNPRSYIKDYGFYFAVIQVILVLMAAITRKRSGCYFIMSKSSPDSDMILSQENKPSKLILKAKEQDSCFERGLVMFRVLSKISFYLGYVYVCERVPIFIKDPLSFSPPFIAASLIVTLFLVFYTYQKISEDVSVLKKQLIDETKGLLIVTLLFLKLNCFSSHQIIIPVSFTESAFIVLCGVEIFQHGWAKKPMNLCHFLQKLYSQNILAVLLCLVLKHPFIYYEIFPLVLVCFSVTYIVLALPPLPVVTTLKNEEVPTNARTATAVYFCKVAILLAGFSLVHNSLNMTEQMFSSGPWSSIFATNEGTFDPWIRRWNKDKFCFLLGIIIGFTFELRHLMGTTKILQCSRLKLLAKALTPAASIFFLYRVHLSIESATSIQQTDNDYPVVLGYLVVSVILLRTSLVQNCFYYSKLLATLGRLWREIYLLHFHIWMSFNGSAFLVLLPFSSFINFCCITFILLLLANDIRQSLNIFMLSKG